jgi:hypothetical protein
LPASIQLWRAHRKQAESADDSERAKEYLDGVWTRSIKNSLPESELTQVARVLQDELYDRRRRSPAIPSFLYKRKLQEYEDQMRQSAAKMASEASQKTT